jgi:hypothetical protein
MTKLQIAMILPLCMYFFLRIANANGGAQRYGVIVLNHSHEGAPVREIMHPNFEAATK